MAHKLIVNQIIPFSNVDGEGNRCAIFLQECNVHCVYCHNPDTINLCNHCGECIQVCQTGALFMKNNKVEFEVEKCVSCQACLKRCSYFSSPKTKAYSVEELLQLIQSYQPFIRGITVSGGEPTLQSTLLVDLFNEVKKLGLSCYIDTNGYFNCEDYKELINVTDQFLVDVKTVGDSERLCLVPSLSSTATLKTLLELNKVEEVRTVLLHSYMECEETVRQVANILKDYPNVLYKLIKVHKIGIMDPLTFKTSFIPSDEKVLKWVQLAQACGVSKISCVL